MDFIFSQDIGRIRDYHAEVLTQIVLRTRERIEHARRFGESSTSDVIYPLILVKFLGRSQKTYPELIEDTKKQMNDPRVIDNCFHIIDATGVGMPVLEMMRHEGLAPIGIWLTAGELPHSQSYGYTVPKLEVISALQMCLSSKMLRFTKNLNPSVVQQLLEEFKKFKEKSSRRTGHTSLEAWREKDHDDLILALAINCWWALKICNIQVIPKGRPMHTDNDYDALSYDL